MAVRKENRPKAHVLSILGAVDYQNPSFWVVALWQDLYGAEPETKRIPEQNDICDCCPVSNFPAVSWQHNSRRL